jgi:hypothetical protein
MDAASFVLPVKMKLKTKVSMLPVILQLMALAMDRGWESPVRINGGFMFVPICSEWPPPTTNPSDVVLRCAAPRALRSTCTYSRIGRRRRACHTRPPAALLPTVVTAPFLFSILPRVEDSSRARQGLSLIPISELRTILCRALSGCRSPPPREPEPYGAIAATWSA